MSKLTLPRPKALQRPEGISWDAPSTALERWAGGPLAAESDDPATISIYEPIGYDWWTDEGFTAKRMAGALRSIGARDVTVAINSPGGDLFEGLAIYNLLAEHPAAVHVRVMGLAASAASVIAMAGDSIAMGLGSFLMIHKAWGVVIGNESDMRAGADLFAQFDDAMADIYVARTGNKRDDVAAMLAEETWMTAKEAVDKGFATATFERESRDVEPSQARADMAARRQIEALLAKTGVPRSERRKLLREVAGTRDAAGTDTPRAVLDAALVAATLETLRS